MSDYINFDGKCIGRVMHFVEHYFGSIAAENCQSDTYDVFLYGKKVATLEWRFDDLPIFNFESSHKHVERIQQNKMLSALKDYWGAPNYDLSYIDIDFSRMMYLGSVSERAYFTYPNNKNSSSLLKDIWFDEKEKMIYAVDHKAYSMSLHYPESELFPIERRAFNRARQYLFSKSIQKDITVSY